MLVSLTYAKEHKVYDELYEEDNTNPDPEITKIMNYEEQQQKKTQNWKMIKDELICKTQQNQIQN